MEELEKTPDLRPGWFKRKKKVKLKMGKGPATKGRGTYKSKRCENNNFLGNRG